MPFLYLLQPVISPGNQRLKISGHFVSYIMNFLNHIAGIHAVVKTGMKLSYVVYNLSSGRAEQDSPFPSDTSSFLGLEPQNISLTSAGEVCV